MLGGRLASHIAPPAAAPHPAVFTILTLALEEYEYWESPRRLEWPPRVEETKKGGRARRRDRRTGRIVWVSPGLVFPIVGAMGKFVVQDETAHIPEHHREGHAGSEGGVGVVDSGPRRMTGEGRYCMPPLSLGWFLGGAICFGARASPSPSDGD